MRAPRQRRALRMTVETEIPMDVAERFHDLYRQTFGPLATLAVSRQVLHEHEFMAEMVDARVDKLLVWDDNDEVVAMATLTRHLETVPWISPEYFAHHFPEHAARGEIYYLGFVLVDEAYRRERLFTQLIGAVVERMVEEDALCAWDICAFNNEVLGLSDALSGLIQSIAEAEVTTLDTQTYYCSRPLGATKMPQMRHTAPENGRTLAAVEANAGG